MGNPRGAKRDFGALERRRLRAARLLARGVSQAEVARQVGAHRESVSRWAQELEAHGVSGLKRAPRVGRKPCLSPEHLGSIEQALKRGPRVFGYATELWTAQQVRDLIAQQWGVKFSPRHVWWLLRRWAGVASVLPDALGNGTRRRSAAGSASAGRS